jgi:hypothetical protein
MAPMRSKLEQQIVCLMNNPADNSVGNIFHVCMRFRSHTDGSLAYCACVIEPPAALPAKIPTAMSYAAPVHQFTSRFLDRANLSFRKMRRTKRPVIDDEACAHFLVQLAAIQAECPVERILNFDESS